MSSENLGPLPKSDRNDDLQELSFRAFQSVFPVDQFRVRGEPGKDTGVDRYLELKLQSFETNLRSQIQLKAEEQAETNNDGTISKSVDTTNVNYLLNGPCPMYVLYIANTHELYYAWVREEAAKGFFQKDHNWQQADSVTIRFDKRLDGTALQAIRERIIFESRLSREVHSRLVRYSISETPRMEIGKDLAVLDSRAAKELLDTAGASLVSSGSAKRLVEIAELLSPADKKAKRVLVILAYAHFTMNRYDIAAGLLREAAIAHGTLTPSDALLFADLQNNCDFRMGRKDKQSFDEKETELANLRSNALRAYVEMDNLRRKHASSERGDESGDVIAAMKGAFERVKTEDGSSRNLVLSAEAILLFSEGHDLVGTIFQKLGTQVIQAQLQTRGMPPTQDQLTALFAEWDRWFVRANDLLTRATQANNPIVVAETLYTRAGVVSLFLIHSVIASEIGWTKRDETFGDLLRQAFSDIERAIEMYVAADMPEPKLHAQLTLADLHEIAGSTAEAVEIATEVQAFSGVMGYESITVQATEIVQGNSHLRKLKRDIKAVDADDSDIPFISMTDRKATTMARDMARTMGLPSDRVSNLIHDLLSARGIAIERRDWCRHLGIVQQLAHTESVATAYREIPTYAVICRLLELHSEDSQDWSGLIPRFKGLNCINCRYRAPKDVRTVESS